jgi:hypothetical protein
MYSRSAVVFSWTHNNNGHLLDHSLQNSAQNINTPTPLWNVHLHVKNYLFGTSHISVRNGVPDKNNARRVRFPTFFAIFDVGGFFLYNEGSRVDATNGKINILAAPWHLMLGCVLRQSLSTTANVDQT